MTAKVYLSLVNPTGVWFVRDCFADSVEEELSTQSAQDYSQQRKEILALKEERWTAIKSKMGESKTKTGSYFSSMVDYNGILTLNMRGEITEYASSWSDSGIVLSDLVPMLEMVQKESGTKDQSVKGVIMRINTPGGIAVPSLNAGEQIAAINKTVPIVAYYDSLCASAGIALTAGCAGVLCSPAIIAGGVAAVYRGIDRADDPTKYRRVTLTSGKAKVATETRGEDGFLDKSAIASRQSEIDKLGTQFVDFVALNRNMDADKKKTLAEGGYWIGKEVLQSGLVDKIALWFDAKADATKLIMKLNAERKDS